MVYFRNVQITYMARFFVGCSLWTLRVGGVQARLFHVGVRDACSLHVSFHRSPRELDF